MNIIKMPKLVLLGPKEYKVVRRILKTAKRHMYIRECLIDNNERCSCIIWDYNQRINEDCMLEWSIEMSRQILKSDSKIKMHHLGHKYRE
jgi:hypothetical protein